MATEKRGKMFKGIISLMILKSLWNEPSYGYLLEKEVSGKLGEKLPNGEIYSILTNMEIRGLIKGKLVVHPVERRKYYEISRKGKEYLLEQLNVIDVTARSLDEIRQFVSSISKED